MAGQLNQKGKQNVHTKWQENKRTDGGLEILYDENEDIDN